MQVRTLRAHMKARGLSQSELARRVGVSRQAVSLWFHQGGEVNLQGRHLLGVGRALGIRAEDLVQPLPGFEPDQHDQHDHLRVRYLWDGLYPDLDDFAIAVSRGEARAVARLVEADGLYATEKVIGKKAWKQFENYKRYIHPVRRRDLETLHEWHCNQTAA